MLHTHQSGAVKWVLFIAVSLLLAKLITGLRIVQFWVIMLVISNRFRATRSADLKLVAQLLPELYSTESNYHY